MLNSPCRQQSLRLAVLLVLPVLILFGTSHAFHLYSKPKLCNYMRKQLCEKKRNNLPRRFIIDKVLPSSSSSSSLVPSTKLRMIPEIVSTSDILSTTASTTTDAISVGFNSMVLIATEVSQQLFPTSPEPIHTAFTIATFLPQPFWLLMILLPNNKVTKSIMGGLEIPLVFCLIHFFIVSQSILMDGTEVTAPLSEFNNVFDPSGDPQMAFMKMTTLYPNFVAEEWSHVLTWDLFIGRYIWLDGIKRNIFTGHSVLFSNLIGPPGLLLHWLTCTLFYSKPILDPIEKEEIMDL